MTLVAFHNNPDFKAAKLAQIAMCREADELIERKDCAPHAYEYESEFGIPVMLTRLEAAIFEGLSNHDAKAWPEQFLDAIEPGADLSLVEWQFLHWLLSDLAERDCALLVKSEILQSASVIEPATRGVPINHKAALAAENAAKAMTRVMAMAAMAARAAWADEAVGAAETARAVAVAIRATDEAVGLVEAVRAAARAEAWADGADRWCEFRDKLLELLKAT